MLKITVKTNLTQETIDNLDKYAQEKKWNRSQAIRVIVEEKLLSMVKPPSKNLFDQISVPPRKIE